MSEREKEGLDAKAYDLLWDNEWSEQQNVGPVHRHSRQLILELARRVPFDNVLDVGCGGGDLLKVIAAAFPEVALAGADLSRTAIEKAARSIDATYHVVDFVKETVETPYDLVIASQVVEHIPDDVSFLRNLRRATRRGAIVSSMVGRMRPSESTIGHVRNYAIGELEEKMQNAGFRVTHSRLWGFPFYSPIFRELIEHLPTGTATGEVGPIGRAIASALYQLYRLNLPGRGDVIFVVGEV